jgi:cell division protein FtsL
MEHKKIDDGVSSKRFLYITLAVLLLTFSIVFIMYYISYAYPLTIKLTPIPAKVLSALI